VANERFREYPLHHIPLSQASPGARTVTDDCNVDLTSYVLIRNVEELFARGLDRRVHGMLDHPHVVVLARLSGRLTARAGLDVGAETMDRVTYFVSQFPDRVRTEKPAEDELLRFLNLRIKDWDIQPDSDKTVRLLVKKSDGVVGYAMNALYAALDLNGGKLTFDFVSRYDANPMLVV
jgi:hypothetical protein